MARRAMLLALTCGLSGAAVTPAPTPAATHSPTQLHVEENHNKPPQRGHMQAQGGDRIQFDSADFYHSIPLVLGLLGCFLVTVRCGWVNNSYKEHDEDPISYGLLPEDARALRSRGLLRDRSRETDSLLSADDGEEGACGGGGGAGYGDRSDEEEGDDDQGVEMLELSLNPLAASPVETTVEATVEASLGTTRRHASRLVVHTRHKAAASVSISAEASLLEDFADRGGRSPRAAAEDENEDEPQGGAQGEAEAGLGGGLGDRGASLNSETPHGHGAAAWGVEESKGGFQEYGFGDDGALGPTRFQEMLAHRRPKGKRSELDFV
mmetsp:Transcript_26202/g.58694  ORF Transcript_26202/g.58694 Transcript_26202/m.58694 type:complete len:323 (-) Transcript_26202:18-986(-)